MTNIPAELAYTEEHEWVEDLHEDNTFRVGITDHAQNELGEVVLVQLPEVGDTVSAGDVVGEVESTKSVSDLYSPVTGTVTAVNEDIDGAYEAINNDPYGEGWLFEVEVEEVGPLMSADEYASSNGV